MLRCRLVGITLTAAAVQDFLFAGGKNGPAGLSDAALIMFANVLQSDWMDTDEAFESLSLLIVGWFELYWTLRLSALSHAPVVADANSCRS